MGAHREYGRDRRVQVNRKRRITAGAPEDQFAAANNPRHRVIHGSDDRPVVDKENVGDSAEPIQRLVFIGANRFVAQIAARGHDG